MFKSFTCALLCVYIKATSQNNENESLDVAFENGEDQWYDIDDRTWQNKWWDSNKAPICPAS